MCDVTALPWYQVNSNWIKPPGKESHEGEGGLPGLWSSAGVQERRKRHNPEKTRRPAASSGMIPTYGNPEAIRRDSNQVHLVEVGETLRGIGVVISRRSCAQREWSCRVEHNNHTNTFPFLAAGESRDGLSDVQEASDPVAPTTARSIEESCPGVTYLERRTREASGKQSSYPTNPATASSATMVWQHCVAGLSGSHFIHRLAGQQLELWSCLGPCTNGTMRGRRVAHIVRRFLDDRRITLLPWPARPQDLSAVENVWSMVVGVPQNNHGGLLTRIKAAWVEIFKTRACKLPCTTLSALTLGCFTAKGTAVVKWLEYSPTTEANQVKFPAGSLPDFRMRESRFSHSCIPTLIHLQLVSPSSALKALLYEGHSNSPLQCFTANSGVKIAEGRSDTPSASTGMTFLAAAADVVEKLLKSYLGVPQADGRARRRDAAVHALHQLLESVRACASQPHVVLVMFKVVNLLIYLLAKKGDPEESHDLLLYGNGFYDKFRELAEAPCAQEDLLQESDVILPGDDSPKRLLNAHLLNLYCLAFRVVLRLTLQADVLDKPELASNMALFASHFLDKIILSQARRYLTAARTILDSCDARDTLRVRVNVTWCWVKCALQLFSVSRSRVMKQVFNDRYFHKLWELPFDEAAPSGGAGKCEVEETARRGCPQRRCGQVRDILDEILYKKMVEMLCKTDPKVRGDGEAVIENKVNGRERTEQQDTSADEKARGDGDDEKKTTAGGVQEEGQAGLDTHFLEDKVQTTYIETAQLARELFLFAQAHWRQEKGLPGPPRDAELQRRLLCRHLKFFERGEEEYAAQRGLVEAMRASLYGDGGAEYLRELLVSEVELLQLNLRRIHCTLCDTPRKTMTLQDMHVCLNQLSSSLLDVLLSSGRHRRPDSRVRSPDSHELYLV
ncbi:hypothetical protein PR048_026077 [Dryococelus australis]|uniref:Uncharacterized protein n=1 Tax=Dryococelus australis TaxID=614101 RepID=A0ABQ9GKB3_9NEOP|nr:hypothetical protein PR048_026077 [Dryococelus australis]